MQLAARGWAGAHGFQTNLQGKKKEKHESIQRYLKIKVSENVLEFQKFPLMLAQVGLQLR